jgi:hypothetical protein
VAVSSFFFCLLVGVLVSYRLVDAWVALGGCTMMDQERETSFLDTYHSPLLSSFPRMADAAVSVVYDKVVWISGQPALIVVWDHPGYVVVVVAHVAGNSCVVEILCNVDS